MLKVAVTGASGYMGAELLRLLSVHPKVRISAVTSERLAGERLDRLYPHLRGLSDLVFQEIDGERLAAEADVIFLALPHMESQRLMPTLRRHGKKAVDLSADYRLERRVAVHDVVQGAPRGRERAGRGGLRPARAAPQADRGRVPGGLARLLPDGRDPRHRAAAQERARERRRHRDRRQVGRDRRGAQGRKADAMYLFTEANENVQAYGMATHRHTPEIEQELSLLAGRPVVVAFTPHLVPLNRGLFTTASVPLTKPATTAELVALYQEFYAGEPFVRVLDEGQRPTTRSVVGSNFCDVTVVADPRTKRAVCVSALDNLGKGGSANGIQNLNIMMGWDERTGLDAPPVYP